jgi:shikimate kinase
MDRCQTPRGAHDESSQADAGGSSEMNVALFGFMAVGKSTVGRLLSKRLGYTFVDVDSEIAGEEGIEIAEIFSAHGEAGFRELERQAIRRVALLDHQVIACGGGAVLDSSNLEALRRSSRMVLLTANAEEISRRVAIDSDRPLLNVEDRFGRIRDLLEARLPKYHEAAEVSVNTDGITPEEVTELILERLRGVEE